MKFAYISTQEQVNSYDGTLLGQRVCQVQDTKHGLVDVPGLLFWVECADNIAAENSYYDTAEQQVKTKPVRP